jgi:uncharacterized RDD family membrane protein YckC
MRVKCAAMDFDIKQAETPALPRRLAAIFYDSVLVFALLVLAFALLVVPLGVVFGVDAGDIARHPLGRLYLASVIAGFFCGFWLRGGETLGMRSWRVRLVRDNGRPLTLGVCLLRLAAAALSWAALGLGFLWSLVDPERLTWHDRLSGTRLVLVKKG